MGESFVNDRERESKSKSLGRSTFGVQRSKAQVQSMFDGYLRRSMTGSVPLRKAAAFQRDLHPFSGSYCMQYCASGGPHVPDSATGQDGSI